MRRLLMILWLAVLPSLTSAAPAEHRIALVIGNARYTLRPLGNPVNDARLIAERLISLGFRRLASENSRLSPKQKNISAEAGEAQVNG